MRPEENNLIRMWRSIVLGGIFGLSLWLSSSLAQAQLAPLTGPLPSGRLDPNDVIINKRPPVPFQPFDLIDPKTRQKVAPNALITLPNGQQVQAGAYYGEINRLEQGFNQLGYSFRDLPNRPPDQRKRVVQLQYHRLDPQQLQQQSDLLRRDHVIPPSQQVPVPLAAMPQLDLQFRQGIQSALVAPRSTEGSASPEERQAFRQHQEQALKDKLMAERIEADRELGVHLAESEYQEGAKEIAEDGKKLETQSATTQGTEPIGEQDREAFAQWRDTQRRLSGATSAEGGVTSRQVAPMQIYTGGIIATTAYQFHRNKGVDWSGGNSWFGAYVKGKTTLDGYSTMVTTHGDIDVGGTVIGSTFSLLNGQATATAPQSGPMTAIATLSIVGTTIMNINKSQTVAWSDSSGPARPFNKSTPPLTIWIGPIPLTVKAGIQGSSGMQYTIGFQPVRAYVNLGPTLNVNAYAQASIGVDLSIVGAQAGIRGTLVLIKEQLIGLADAALKLVNNALVYQTTFAIYDSLDMLDGTLVAFASVDHPCVPDVWNTCTDEWDDTLWSWTGIQASGYLVNEVATTNVYGRPQAIGTLAQ